MKERARAGDARRALAARRAAAWLGRERHSTPGERVRKPSPTRVLQGRRYECFESVWVISRTGKTARRDEYTRAQCRLWAPCGERRSEPRNRPSEFQSAEPSTVPPARCTLLPPKRPVISLRGRRRRARGLARVRPKPVGRTRRGPCPCGAAWLVRVRPATAAVSRGAAPGPSQRPSPPTQAPGEVRASGVAGWDPARAARLSEPAGSPFPLARASR